MNIVERAKNILLKPADEWSVIAAEPTSVQQLFTGYAVILALLPVAGMVLFGGLLGIGYLGFSAVAMMAGVGYVLGLGLLYVIGLVVNAVAPSLGGKADMTQTMKLLVYASTPNWLVGFISPLLPIAGTLLSLAAVAYAIYLIYMGVRPVMGVPGDKAVGFTVVTVLIYFVASFVVTSMIMGAMMASFIGTAMMTGMMQ